MKKNILLILIICCVSTCFSQTIQLPKKSVQFNIDKSKHGSGDMNGISLGLTYTRYIKKKLSIDFNFKSTIHDGQDTFLLLLNNAVIQDGSVRKTTAGFQFGSMIRYSLMRSPSHEFLIGLGIYGRFQSSSLGDNGYTVSFPQPGNINQPILIAFDNETPQRIYTIGYMTQVSYNYTFKKGLFAGINAGFQNDSNADIITHLGLMIGKRF